MMFLAFSFVDKYPAPYLSNSPAKDETAIEFQNDKEPHSRSQIHKITIKKPF